MSRTVQQISLLRIKRTDPVLLEDMKRHYSAPKGFVGRNQCYAIEVAGKRLGSIVSGSATMHLAGREDWLSEAGVSKLLNSGVNNIFFHLYGSPYPFHDFAKHCVQTWRDVAKRDWLEQYGDEVLWFETLVELPRTGELYAKDGWQKIGETKGYTCKRGAGTGTDSWSGKRVWDTQNLRPKAVFARLPTPSQTNPY